MTTALLAAAFAAAVAQAAAFAFEHEFAQHISRTQGHDKGDDDVLNHTKNLNEI